MVQVGIEGRRLLIGRMFVGLTDSLEGLPARSATLDGEVIMADAAGLQSFVLAAQDLWPSRAAIGVLSNAGRNQAGISRPAERLNR